MAELERKAITATLAANSGNKLATARQLGISRATLYDRMAVLELGAESPAICRPYRGQEAGRFLLFPIPEPIPEPSP